MLPHRTRKSDHPFSPKVLSPRLSPSSVHFPTVDVASLSRIHSPVGRMGTEERQEGYRSPTIRIKHDLLSMLKELRTCEDPPGIKAVRNLYSVVSTLSQEPGYYREEMQLVTRALQKVLYCPKASVPEHIWQYIYARDVEMILEPDSKVPYCHLTSFLVEYVESILAKERNGKEIAKETENRLKAVIQEREAEIEDYKRKIEDLTGTQQPISKELARIMTEVRPI